MFKQLFLMPLAAVFQSGSSADAFAQQDPDQRKVRIEIVTTENGETKRITREFDANDEEQLQKALRDLGVLDHMRVDGDGENVTIDIRRFADDMDPEDMVLSLAPLAPLAPLPPTSPRSPMAPVAPCEPRAYLGVSTAPLSDALRESSKLKGGAHISSVIDDTPAAKAGLQAGDIITAVDNDAVDGPKELSEAVRSHEPGDKVKVTYYRDAKKNSVTVELDAHSDEAFTYSFGMPEHGSEEWDWDSYMGDTPGTPEPRAFLGVTPGDGEADANGATIGGVEEGTAAETMGMKEGDVVRSVNGTPTPDFDALSKAIKAMEPGEAVSVVVARDGKEMTLNGELGESTDMVRSFTMRGMPGVRSFEGAGLDPQERDELRREMDEVRREMTELRRELGRELRSEMRVTLESRTLTPEEKALLTGKGVTGLENELNLGDLRAFPNPSNGFYRLQFDVPERGDLMVDVLDASGERVYQERIIGFKGRYERTLDLSDRSGGSYFLVITQGGKTATRKLVKE